MQALQNLGIDFWSLLLYLVNFGVIIYVLNRYLYKPLLRFLDERRETIRRNLEEAETLKTSFQEEMQKREEESRTLVSRMQQELLESKQYADKKAQELLAEASVQRDKMIEDTRAQLEEMKGRLQQDVEKDLLARVEQTILSVLGNKVPDEVIRESVAETWKEVSRRSN